MEALRWLRALGFAAIGVGIVCSPSVHAAETGTIKGTVVDSAKLALPGARVSVVETSLVALTDNSGAFTLVLPPGRYTVIAELSGFRSETRPEVSVAAGETTALAYHLPF